MGIRSFFSSLSHNATRVMRKHGPTAAIVSGVALMIVGTVEACKATLKVDDIQKTHQEKKEAIKKALEDKTLESYDEKVAAKDTLTLYTQTGYKYVKKYAKAAICLTIGAVLIFGGHKIIKKQLAGAIATAESATTAFARYRQHVKDKLGVEADKAFLLGDVQKVIDSDPVKNKEEQNIIVDGPNPKQLGPFVFKFDDTCKMWCEDPLRRNYRIKSILTTLQDKLDGGYISKNGKRYLTKNDLIRAFGGKTDGEGLTTGWVKAEVNDICEIDLGCFWDDVFLEERSDGRLHEYHLFDLNCQYIGDKL